ncbi:IS66 family insertion sequence element accessory protein TnpA [Clostridium estertheticum]|uniref:IS66 family insertion sequence element accessory protein TnpA n=1 Tax=Clostridium estertheticum TaxID=238834 RepID=UPI003A4C5B85
MSGQTIAIWCKENDVKTARLHSWIREFSTNHITTKEVANWVSVDATELKDVISGNSLIIRLKYIYYTNDLYVYSPPYNATFKAVI